MYFHFIADGNTYDLTDFVDRADIETERVTASTSAGLFVPSKRIGPSWTAGYILQTSGIVSAADHAGLRDILADMMEQRSGYIQIENDRRIPAVLDNLRLSEWESGVPLMRVSMRWLTAGYAESTTVNYGTPISGGWTVSNDGDLPAPLLITAYSNLPGTGRKISINGGVTPDGLSPLPFECSPDTPVGGWVIIDAGVYALHVVSDATDHMVWVTKGYPPFAKVGSSTITYTSQPSNAFTNFGLIYRRRWRFF